MYCGFSYVINNCKILVNPRKQMDSRHLRPSPAFPMQSQRIQVLKISITFLRKLEFISESFTSKRSPSYTLTTPTSCSTNKCYSAKLPASPGIPTYPHYSIYIFISSTTDQSKINRTAIRTIPPPMSLLSKQIRIKMGMMRSP